MSFVPLKRRIRDVLHTVRKLAREIHRRSVWQVLGAFLALAWMLLQLIVFLTRTLGLPLWTPRLAVVLLAVGLPLVIATSVVQEGIPFLRITDLMDPNELEGRTPEEVHVVPEAHPLYGTSLLTWRNLALGGVMAGALLVTSVVAYLSMWALGIGPVGSLMAQGRVAENDTIIVADFDNRSDDPAVSREVARRLQSALARSSVVHVLDDPDLSGALGRGEGVVADARRPRLASLLRARPSVRIVVDGEVRRFRGGYRILVSMVSVDGTTLARFEGSVRDAEGLGPGIEDLSARLRERIGESLRVIQSEFEHTADP